MMHVLGIHIEPLKNDQMYAFMELLHRHHLAYEPTVEETLVMLHEGRMIGTCSSEGKIIKMFAVDRCYQGGGYASALLTQMLNLLFDKGHFTVLAYTLSKNRCIFEAMQFRCIYDTMNVALLSIGVRELERSLNQLEMTLPRMVKHRGAIVMNGNPFTKGHAYLIEEACKQCDELIVFVVETDKSSFNTAERLQMIQLGTAHLKNVKVVLGGAYIVSSATFPQYFERSEEKIAQWSAELDAGIFCSIYAKALEIESRFVGTEPYCQLTAKYNTALKRICAASKMTLKQIERLQIDGMPVSASLVRNLIRARDWVSVKALVPATTYAFLRSEDTKTSIEGIQAGRPGKH